MTFFYRTIPIRIAASLALGLPFFLQSGVRPGFTEEKYSIQLSKDRLQEAFRASHDGWSLDEVMLSDARRKAVVDEVKKSDPAAVEKQIWEELVRLRKSGKLDAETSRRETTEYGETTAVAEIAARRMQDEQNVTFDQVLIDPVLLKRFDECAQAIDNRSDPYTVRKAALRLRKSRQLKPELVLRVTDWKKDIMTMSVEEAKRRVKTLPSRPGIYIFRDTKGFVYIGQSNNLRERLTKHLDASDRLNLANYLAKNDPGNLTLELHIFREGSPAEQTVVREAYESELIRSRKPRLNLSP
ncbi:MAG: GIY-YIG nuclease family protein [Pirellulaceae bacterium]|nr:GIY-YIG nuclease family protein [Pirellulaceae bacterium]